MSQSIQTPGIVDHGLKLRRAPAVLAAAAAGAICVAALAAVSPVFHLSEELVQSLRHPLSSSDAEETARRQAESFGAAMAQLPGPPDLIAARTAAERYVARGNGAFAAGLLGLTLGGALSLSEAAARRRGNRIWLKGLAGAVACTAIGCLGGYLGMELGFFLRSSSHVDLLLCAMLVQAVLLATLGAGIGAGLAVFIGWRRPALSSVLRGLSAGVLAGLFAPLVTAFVGIFASTVRTESFLPGGFIEQVIWVGVSASAFALTMPWATRVH